MDTMYTEAVVTNVAQISCNGSGDRLFQSQ